MPCFILDKEGRVVAGPVVADRVNHGAQLADILLSAAPQVRLLNAQVFRDRVAATPAAIAAALDWLVAEGTRLVNISAGLRQDRRLLREAVAAAVRQGVLLICATPARGGPVFPAAYPGSVPVCGDARCGPGQWSVLPDGPALLGACPRPRGPVQENLPQGGSSFAAAHLSGVLAAFWVEHPAPSSQEAWVYLERRCRFYGRERRG